MVLPKDLVDGPWGEPSPTRPFDFLIVEIRGSMLTPRQRNWCRPAARRENPRQTGLSFAELQAGMKTLPDEG